MKVWPIDPLVPRNLRLEVPEKLPQGFQQKTAGAKFTEQLVAAWWADFDALFEFAGRRGSLNGQTWRNAPFGRSVARRGQRNSIFLSPRLRPRRSLVRPSPSLRWQEVKVSDGHL